MKTNWCQNACFKSTTRKGRAFCFSQYTQGGELLFWCIQITLFSLLKSVYFMLTIPSDLSIASARYVHTHAYVCMYFMLPLGKSIFRYLCTFLQTFLFESNNIWCQVRPNNYLVLINSYVKTRMLFHTKSVGPEAEAIVSDLPVGELEEGTIPTQQCKGKHPSKHHF